MEEEALCTAPLLAFIRKIPSVSAGTTVEYYVQRDLDVSVIRSLEITSNAAIDFS